MSRKKKKPGRIGGRIQPAAPQRAAQTALDEAFRLKNQRRYDKAIELLDQIDRLHPGQRDVLVLLSECLADTKDWHRQLEVSERLVSRFPQDGDLNLMLAGSYLTNFFPILALHQFQVFLSRWPIIRAGDARKTVADLEPRVARIFDDMGQHGPDRMELGVLHERIQISLSRARYSEVRRQAEQFLQRWPRFCAALNNLAEGCFAEGAYDEAIAASRRAIEAAPENVHAWANLTRHLFLSGRIEEAREAGARLASMPAQRPENWIKKAETFSFLGDDEAVIAAWRAAEAGGFRIVPTTLALLHHLAAVAFARQGNEAEARRLWRLSLNLYPALSFASENLRDLDLPVGERNGPWAYNLEYWLHKAARDKLALAASNSTPADSIRDFPGLVALIPHMIDRGDAASRELALEMCAILKTPELLALLCDFALGQRGSDKQRTNAAFAARRVDALPAGKMRLWIKGEWREQLLLGFEITREPLKSVSHTPAVTRLSGAGIEALHEGDGRRAERLFREALELEPDALDLQNNLANSYLLQRRPALARAIFVAIHQKHPEYLFAAVEVARMHIEAGQIDQATEMLQPFLLRSLLHITEFHTLAHAHVELGLACNQPETARSWVGMVERIDPDSPRLAMLRAMMEKPRRWTP